MPQQYGGNNPVAGQQIQGNPAFQVSLKSPPIKTIPINYLFPSFSNSNIFPHFLCLLLLLVGNWDNNIMAISHIR
jgi:hypothetical protein